MPTLMDGRKSHITTDPVRNFKFLVNIRHSFNDTKFGNQNLARMGFMNMSGLAMTTEVIPYREGGNNTTQRKMPGQSNFNDVTLSRGVVLGNTQPWAWTRQIFSANAGEGNAGPTTNFRCNVDVYVLAHPVTNSNRPPAHVKFRIYNAWITGLAFSELDAGGNAVLVQQLTLAHKGFEMNMASQLSETVAP
jgi:phage tail-like protein